MNENDLNIEYICEKTLLNKDDELVPIILDLIQDSYKAGLCQAEFDNTMNLIEENEELKEEKQEWINLLAMFKNQQKEFIEWLEAMSVMYENEYKDIDVADHYNCALQKYKEIIGVLDENNKQ